MTITVIGVRFKEAGKIYYFDPDQMEINAGDHVIVETARGIEYGSVVVGLKQVSEEEIVPPLKKVIGTVWFDTAEKIIKYWNGTEWVPFGAAYL